MTTQKSDFINRNYINSNFILLADDLAQHSWDYLHLTGTLFEDANEAGLFYKNIL